MILKKTQTSSASFVNDLWICTCHEKRDKVIYRNCKSHQDGSPDHLNTDQVTTKTRVHQEHYQVRRDQAEKKLTIFIEHSIFQCFTNNLTQHIFFFFIPKVFSVTFFFAIESSLSETKTRQSKTAGRFRDETATFKKWS